MVYGASHTVAEIDHAMNLQATVSAQQSAINYASNNVGSLNTWTSNTSAWASNKTAWTSNNTTSTSNTAFWTSNALQRNYTGSVYPLNANWFGSPIYSKSYSISNYASDVVIDSLLKSSSYTVIAMGGSALFSNQNVPLPATHLSGYPGLYVTPYTNSNSGLSASTSLTLDRLDLWVNYVAAPYNTL